MSNENETSIEVVATPAPAEILPALTGEQRVLALMEDRRIIDMAMKEVLVKGEHYGVIPGCGPKPTLFKAGAEALMKLFRLACDYDVTFLPTKGEHREVSVKCILTSFDTGKFMGAGVGSCSTMESKYRYRQATRKCPRPECNAEAIIKGKDEYGGGWLCWKKKDGCGAKFEIDDPAIIGQDVGRIENEDLADQYNTILKMAKKRALVDAVLTRTAAGDVFSQDLEDIAPMGSQPQEPPPSNAPPPAEEPPAPVTPEVDSDKLGKLAAHLADIPEQDAEKIIKKIGISWNNQKNKGEIDSQTHQQGVAMIKVYDDDIPKLGLGLYRDDGKGGLG